MNNKETEELLSNIDLKYLCMSLGIKLNGIYFTKELKSVSPIIKEGAYIFNLAPDTINGVHWTCMYVKNRRIAYYDPFGMAPSQDILDFIKSQKTKFQIIYNQLDNQHIMDVHCGWYCLAFLYSFTNYKEVSYYYLSEFNKQFVDNSKLNINYLRQFIKNIFPSYYIL